MATMQALLFDVQPTTPTRRPLGHPVVIPSDRTCPTQHGAAHPGPVNPLMRVTLTEGNPDTGFGLALEPVDQPAEPTSDTADIVIEHSSAAGTLLIGSEKGDGVYDALRNAGQRWRTFRTAEANGYPRGTLYIPQSRDRAPKFHIIRAAERVLREAGFSVRVEIDAAPRQHEEVVADKIERLHERADALTSKAERRAAESDARHQAASGIAKRFADGQPIIVGHHSERKARRDQERIHNHMRKAVELADQAEQAADRADTAARHAEILERGEHPHVIVRRIERLEADERRIQRALDGHTRRHLDGNSNPVYVDTTPPAKGEYRERLRVRMEHVQEQLRGNRAALDKARAEGRYVEIDPKAIKPGHLVRYSGRWHEVTKVNRKTVSVKTGYSWDDKIPLAQVSGHRIPEDAAQQD